MGLLDQVAGALTGTKGAGVNAVLLQQLMSMLSKPGALSGRVNFHLRRDTARD
jgi:Rod binding domain-containing protein